MQLRTGVKWEQTGDKTRERVVYRRKATEKERGKWKESHIHY